MGQLVHFYAGDPMVVGRAFAAHDVATLQNRSAIPLFADFSLHLSPIDFDLLTEAIQAIVGAGPGSLTDSLQTPAAQTSSDGSSADIVANEWVEMVASLGDDQIEPMLERWIRAVADEHSEPVSEPTDDVRVAIRELVDFCRESRARHLPVVLTWSM